MIGNSPRTISEKALAVAKLLSLPRGRVDIPSAKKFFGWQ
jgi:hypothetical protein